MKYGGYFLCRTDQMWQDSWSYGDWKQYICNRPDQHGETQCARISVLPFWSLMIGIAAFTMGLLGVTFGIATDMELNWTNVFVMLIVGATLIGWYLINEIMGVKLMVPVGPMNKGAHRVCPWDKER